MEGVIDHNMRDLLTRVGGYDRCVTEFIRVSTHAVPEKVFRRYCPELNRGGLTPSGVPVYIQLLGGDAHRMAKSAVVAADAGAAGIDLNFGCPAKVVNRHDGGSALLREPSRIGKIVNAVRQAVDCRVPVSAKIRLGLDDASLLADIAGHVADAGADELCIHARTRSDGYRPPAHWRAVRGIGNRLPLKTLINGEIWTPRHAVESLYQSGCDHLMLGRGALARPDLALAVRSALSIGPMHDKPMSWENIAALLEEFFHRQDSGIRKYVGNRTKQWLGYLRKQYPQAESLFQSVKRSTDRDLIAAMLARHARGAGDGENPVERYNDPDIRIPAACSC